MMNDCPSQHEMPNISFASGGDSDTLDYIAYVAKDGAGCRACYVLECTGGSTKFSTNIFNSVKYF